MRPALDEPNRSSLGELLASLDRLLAAREGPRTLRLHGVEGSLLALVAARIAGRASKAGPLVLVARDGASAQALTRDLQFFLPDAAGDDPARPPRVMVLPELETSPWADTSPDRRAILRRMATLFRLSQG